MNAVQLKQFINRVLGIPKAKLRADTQGKYWEVRIKPEPSLKWNDPLVFTHSFPAEFGNRCMRIIYAGSESLSAQNWGGNVNPTSIAMRPGEWAKLVAQYEPVASPAEAVVTS